MKRTLSLFLSILFIIYLLPLSASAFTAFTDTVKGSWYEDSLNYCYDHGYMKGTAENKFSPAGKLTRAMTVQLFYSINDVDKPEAKDSFTDVKQSYWFYDAVEWAFAEGIVSGTGNRKFSPNRDVTRQDFYVILYNYSEKFSHYDSKEINDNYLYFTDNETIAEYALTAMNWAARNGFLSGYEDGTVRPYSTMTRAEITSVIKRFDDTLGHSWTLKDYKTRTCTEDGYSLYVCKDCPSSKRVEFEKGHIRYINTESKGSCITKGHLEYRCHNCNIILSVPTSYGSHSFVLTSTVKPTRVKDGYSIYTCEYCGGT
ncbi:MAG: S-layer homology domain-containing protein, partial [Clostridia bacterium]|nr:S-layer homology domain-containing protein [Clostridia bacterium]